MAKMTVKGLDEYARMLSHLESGSEGIAKRGVYKGAKVIADEVKNEMRALPVSNERGTPEKPIKGITAKQKADLIDGMGLAEMQNDNGFINTKLGFDGYGSTPTKKYPKGLPNALLARAITSGTSFRQKDPFVRRAVNRARGAAQEAMAEEIDNAIRSIAGK